MPIMSTILILVATYLIGTLPTAWIVVRRHGQDIREETVACDAKSVGSVLALFLEDMRCGPYWIRGRWTLDDLGSCPRSHATRIATP